MHEATEAMKHARAMAEEATQAGREAAREAQDQLDRVAADRQQDVDDAQAAVQKAEQVHESVADQALALTREKQAHTSNGNGLSTMTKSELVDLAAAQQIEGRASMNKTELVRALGKAAK